MAPIAPRPVRKTLAGYKLQRVERRGGETTYALLWWSRVTLQKRSRVRCKRDALIRHSYYKQAKIRLGNHRFMTPLGRMINSKASLQITAAISITDTHNVKPSGVATTWI